MPTKSLGAALSDRYAIGTSFTIFKVPVGTLKIETGEINFHTYYLSPSIQNIIMYSMQSIQNHPWAPLCYSLYPKRSKCRRAYAQGASQRGLGQDACQELSRCRWPAPTMVNSVENNIHFHSMASSNSEMAIKLKWHDAKIPCVQVPGQTFWIYSSHFSRNIWCWEHWVREGVPG